MKAILTLIRAVFIVTATFVFLFGAKAEIFIGSSTNVNSLVIASNEVILISAARIATIYVEMSIAGKINLNGTMQSLGMDSFCEKPLALAGPATLSFPADSGTNSLPVCICFQRISGSSIQSVYVPYFSPDSPPAVQVPAGKTCHLFRPICDNNDPGTDIFANVQTTSNAVNNIQIFGGEEFTGPVNLAFSNQDFLAHNGSVVSFYQTDDALNLPNGVLQGPTGSFVITVEKSTDLTHWSPVMIQATGDDQAAFYRLNFSH